MESNPMPAISISQKNTPAKMPGYVLVEAAGQLVLIFRKGLDYTFIPLQDAERVIHGPICRES
jgi:hypothetical protein